MQNNEILEIYFNWLGEWKKIDNDHDIICYKNPKEFVEELVQYTNKELMDNKKLEFYHFVQISVKDENKLYTVHISQIMWQYICD